MKKFRAIFCEHGQDCLGGHKDEWRLLGDFDTREEAVEVVKKDMGYYKEQWGKGTEFNEDGWFIQVQDDFLDASCEWDVVEQS